MLIFFCIIFLFLSHTIIGGDFLNINRSIGCEVTTCKYHAKEQPYCSLDNIQVVQHNNQASSVEETDCGSFKNELK
ncbi:uncharacterized protein DUF1540 [Natranaerovirga hydrolytica]|uniref:Uncharacterized protein DUF1540 n=1 Tax=Natranaerovirga hydrolytica TaxID=680378 RepID=A0A4R1MX15_9FIRM|nr:uncharacterized protein DUF1540 [Natranaerovirga hydrolytica]